MSSESVGVEQQPGDPIGPPGDVRGNAAGDFEGEARYAIGSYPVRAALEVKRVALRERIEAAAIELAELGVELDRGYSGGIREILSVAELYAEQVWASQESDAWRGTRCEKDGEGDG